MKLINRLSDGARRRATEASDRASLAAHGDRGPSMLSVVAAGVVGTAAGAIGAFLLDPARGRARRAQFTDRGAATVRRGAEQAERAVRRATAGLAARSAAMQAATTSREARPTDDATLTDRVQSTIFRDESVPKGTINVNVERGIVVLRGEVPDAEMRERLVEQVEGIDGVWSVRDLLHLPDEVAPTTAS